MWHFFFLYKLVWLYPRAIPEPGSFQAFLILRIIQCPHCQGHHSSLSAYSFARSAELQNVHLPDVSEQLQEFLSTFNALLFHWLFIWWCFVVEMLPWNPVVFWNPDHTPLQGRSMWHEVDSSTFLNLSCLTFSNWSYRIFESRHSLESLSNT